MTKNIAFISDIHGNIEALYEVLKDIQKRNIDLNDVYCLGDLVGYGPRPNEVIETIQENKIKSILGNYDEAVGFYLSNCGCTINSEIDRIRTKNSLEWTSENTKEKNKEFLRSLEENIKLEIENINIFLTHASPSSISEYIFENDIETQEYIAEDLEEDILIFGHTHLPYCKKIKDKLFINVGSVGRPKDLDNRACYCILTLDNNIKVEFVRVRYDVEKVANEIEKTWLLKDFAEILRRGRIEE